MRITLFGPAGEVVLDLKGAMMGDVERVSIEEGDHAVEARRCVLEDGASGLLHTITGAMPDVAMVHVLWGGQSLCKRGRPEQWPPTHTWIDIKAIILKSGLVTCKECQIESARIVKDARELYSEEQFNQVFGIPS